MSFTRAPCLLATSRWRGKARTKKCFGDPCNKSLCNPFAACYMPAHADARSPIAQLVEHSTVNRMVAGSSPARGAITAQSFLQTIYSGLAAFALRVTHVMSPHPSFWPEIPVCPA